MFDVLAQERLAPGEAYFLDAEGGEDAHESRDLLERQDLGAFEKRVILAEYFLWHAVDAPEVAAVRDRNAQVAQRPAEGVLDVAGDRCHLVHADRQVARVKAFGVQDVWRPHRKALESAQSNRIEDGIGELLQKPSVCHNKVLMGEPAKFDLPEQGESATLPPMEFKRRISVVMERTPLASRWQSEKWEAKGVLPDMSGAGAEPRIIYDDGTRLEVLYSGLEINLKGEDLENYYLNLTSPEPKVFVLVRADDGTPRPAFVSVSYARAAGWMDANETVDAVSLPPELHAWVGEFVERYYRPRPKFKRQRK